jgi:hypothetical protein
MEDKLFQKFVTALGVTASIITIWHDSHALAVASGVAITLLPISVKKQNNKHLLKVEISDYIHLRLSAFICFHLRLKIRNRNFPQKSNKYE